VKDKDHWAGRGLGTKSRNSIGFGRAYKHQAIHLLVADRRVRILAEDGALIRELTLDPTRNFQAQQPA
jgi:hypothetical protein